MVERTPGDFAAAQDDSGGGPKGDFWSRLERILKKPEVQQRLLAEAPPEVQTAVMSEFSNPDEQSTATATDADQEASSDGAVTPEKMVGFLSEIEEQVGGNTTVAQLKMFAEANPETVDQLLAEYL